MARGRITYVLIATALAAVGAASLFVARGRVDRTPGETPPAATLAIGEEVPETGSLRDLYGNVRAWDDLGEASAFVLAFLGVECPLANLYVPQLVELEAQYRDAGVLFLAIYPHEHETVDLIAAHAWERNIAFPTLKDGQQQLADALGVTRTPTVCVLDSLHRLHYRGRIDDRHQVSARRQQASRDDLREALDEVLAGRPVSVPETVADGCLLDRAASADHRATPTYAADVAPILQQRCEPCHRPARPGPFTLQTYEDAKRWSSMIREVVHERRMPPWHADPRYGKFSNDRRLSDAEIATIVAWIDGGMPLGDKADLPPPIDWPDGWALGQPDLVVTADEAIDVPATGIVPYQYIDMPVESTADAFAEDRWLQWVEVRPGAPQVVHHMTVYFVPPGVPGPEEDMTRVSGMGSWAPGEPAYRFPPGTALHVARGSRIVLQAHYTPNGLAVQDRPSVALKFADEPPEQEIRAIFQNLVNFQIPPHAPDYRLKMDFTVPEDIVLLALMPHMHARGRAFRFDATFPDGRQEVLLSVPRYDFNWQTIYWLQDPLNVPRGTYIEVVAQWDNSRHNLFNPDPSEAVIEGPQITNEMMVASMFFIFDRSAADESQRGQADE